MRWRRESSLNLEQSEEMATELIFEWARWHERKYKALKAMYHVPNEGKRTARSGARLKKQGMKSGVSDICLPYASSGYSNLYIELKVGKNTPTKEQIAFIELINEIGGKGLIVYEADNAIEVIESYLNGTIDSIVAKDNIYPPRQHRRSNKSYIGFCGKDCRDCENTDCLGRTVK